MRFVEFCRIQSLNKNENENVIKFNCDKRIGRIGYMSPEIYARRDFDGRLADVWGFRCYFI